MFLSFFLVVYMNVYIVTFIFFFGEEYFPKFNVKIQCTYTLGLLYIVE